MYKIQGWVEQGNTVIETQGLPSTNVAQGSFPGALVTVYVHGTVTLAQLFSDDNLSPTPLANPFTSNSDGSFGFYAVTGRYDVIFSGGDLTAPVTIDDVTNGAGGGTGTVVGPLSSVDSDIVLFDGVTGVLVKDSGSTIAQLTAAILAAVPPTIVPSLCNGRLTLASGFPIFAPIPATPSSTDTGTEVVTFAADPGWPTGTILTPASTLAGLTAGTRYYFGRLSSVTGAFYTSVANANADTSRVNLSASVTQSLIPSGISQTSIKFTPYNGAQISLYDGVSTWTMLTFIETSLALGTLTSGLPYDVFAFNNSGTLALELLAWTSASARATAIVQQDGVWVKTGATTRRLLGTILTDSTTTTIDDIGGLTTLIGGKRYVSNVYNQVPLNFRVKDTSTTWGYSSATWRQANGQAGNKCEFMVSVLSRANGMYMTSINGPGVWSFIGVNLDSITATPLVAIGTNTNAGVSNWNGTSVNRDDLLQPGYHYYAEMERTDGGAGVFSGNPSGDALSGLAGAVFG